MIAERRYEHLYYATQAERQTERQTQYNTEKNTAAPTANSGSGQTTWQHTLAFHHGKYSTMTKLQNPCVPCL